jgi:transcriptional regulator with XRE-family HTH domain
MAMGHNFQDLQEVSNVKQTTIGSRLRAERLRKGIYLGMTLRKLEAKSKVSIATISHIENGYVKDPGVNTIKKLAKALKCDASWLAFGE